MIHVFNLVVLSPFGAYIGHVVAKIRHFALVHSVSFSLHYDGPRKQTKAIFPKVKNE